MSKSVVLPGYESLWYERQWEVHAALMSWPRCQCVLARVRTMKFIPSSLDFTSACLSSDAYIEECYKNRKIR